MGVIINSNKLVIMTEPKTIYFDFLIEIKNYLKHETDFIVKLNKFLGEQT